MGRKKYSLYLRLMLSIMLIIIVMGIIVRFTLAYGSGIDSALTFAQVLRCAAVGVINDIFFAVIALLPFVLICLGLVNGKYNKPWCYIIEFLLIVAVIYVFCFHSIFHDYGGGAPLIAQIFFTYKLVSFTLRLVFPQVRSLWRKVTIIALFAIYVFCIFFNCVGEYLFWDEFGVRYNFIAVDYLVYTNEVVGNIIESYSILPLLISIIAITALTLWLCLRRITIRGDEQFSIKSLIVITISYVVVFASSCFGLELVFNKLSSNNTYVNQLQSNGGYDFYKAFRSNELDYSTFYPLLSDEECNRLYEHMTAIRNVDTTLRERRNIVLISVESLSADFLSRYGNTLGLTPYLDSLVSKSITFDSLYAVGNRTVRGLEALSICMPPTAGESIVKRPDNKRTELSIGAHLRNCGYTVQYVYGGDSYFDNMGDYFSNNGYDIIDKKSFMPDEITFSNIWGVCDEDTYNKTLRVLDDNYSLGKPFFTHIMTVSNHRPFTYPGGKITMPDNNYKSRNAGIKYTDYAIGQFLHQAEQKPWFANTIFVIIADHCASSAGKTSVPVYNYHIPCFIYAPKIVKPQVIDAICSQIDIMPTVLAMAGINDAPHSAGQNVFSSDFKQRAFMATYQDLGYLENDTLTVMTPVRQVKQFKVTYNPDGTTTETPLTTLEPLMIKKAQAYYQTANLHYNSGKTGL